MGLTVFVLGKPSSLVECLRARVEPTQVEHLTYLLHGQIIESFVNYGRKVMQY
jgi:hypothetical protein